MVGVGADGADQEIAGDELKYKIHKKMDGWEYANVCGYACRERNSEHWRNVTCKNCLRLKVAKK